jgi:hypothetical protein
VETPPTWLYLLHQLLTAAGLPCWLSSTRWLLLLLLLRLLLCCNGHLVRWQPGGLLHRIPVNQRHAVLRLLLLAQLLRLLCCFNSSSTGRGAAAPHTAQLLLLLLPLPV